MSAAFTWRLEAPTSTFTWVGPDQSVTATMVPPDRIDEVLTASLVGPVGPRGSKGDPGKDASINDEIDMPDLVLLFENRLV